MRMGWSTKEGREELETHVSTRLHILIAVFESGFKRLESRSLHNIIIREVCARDHGNNRVIISMFLHALKDQPMNCGESRSLFILITVEMMRITAVPRAKLHKRSETVGFPLLPTHYRMSESQRMAFGRGRKDLLVLSDL